MAPTGPGTTNAGDQLRLKAQLPNNATLAPIAADGASCVQTFSSIDTLMSSSGDLRDFPAVDFATKDSIPAPDVDLSRRVNNSEATDQIFSPNFEHFMTMPYDFIYPLPQTDFGMFDTSEAFIQHGVQPDSQQGLSRFRSRLPSLEPTTISSGSRIKYS